MYRTVGAFFQASGFDEIFLYKYLASSFMGAATYQLGNTSSSTITEVKEC